jgi:ParB-like chromosome segregation protein Spo0J
MSAVRVYWDVLDIPIDKIKPYWSNPRCNDKTKEALVGAYKTIGFNQPILIDQEHVIVKGHARYYAAKIAGMKIIPCVISKATPEENQQDRILDNAIQELSVWDPEMLKHEIEAVDIEIQHVFCDLKNEIEASIAEGEPKIKIICPGCGEETYIPKSEIEKLEVV